MVKPALIDILCVGVLLVLLALPAIAQENTRGGVPNVDGCNYVLGTQTIGSKYRFTEDTLLVESAKEILAMGSNILKIHLEPKSYIGVPNPTSALSLAELVQTEPSFKTVLEMPFSYILMWAYTSVGTGWYDGLSEQETQAEYREMRQFVEHLLAAYSGSGKTFYIGHWEGDWHLHHGYDPKKDPPAEAIQGMIDWYNVRQKAVADALRETPHEGVNVYHYAEVNLVRKAIDGGHTITNDVLPHTNVDYVSYSSYDSLGSSEVVIRQRLTEALDYIDSKLPAKPSVPGKRVFIGEYGFPMDPHGPEKQCELSRAVAKVALEWGCPFALYWEMYCNEVRDGKHRGFWLIDDKGDKQPVYNMHHEFLKSARQFAQRFADEHGRLPTDAELREHALSLL